MGNGMKAALYSGLAVLIVILTQSDTWLVNVGGLVIASVLIVSALVYLILWTAGD